MRCVCRAVVRKKEKKPKKSRKRLPSQNRKPYRARKCASDPSSVPPDPGQLPTQSRIPQEAPAFGPNGAAAVGKRRDCCPAGVRVSEAMRCRFTRGGWCPWGCSRGTCSASCRRSSSAFRTSPSTIGAGVSAMGWVCQREGHSHHPVALGAACLPALLVEGAAVGAGLASASLGNARDGGEDGGDDWELHFEGWRWWSGGGAEVGLVGLCDGLDVRLTRMRMRRGKGMKGIHHVGLYR